jgi:DNA polymerase III delta subunit
MKPKVCELSNILSLFNKYRDDSNNHVIVWNPNSSLMSKIEGVCDVNVIKRDMKTLKKNIASYIGDRISNTNLLAESSALKCFSDTIGSSDYSYDINYDNIEMKYRPLLLKCINKGRITTNDVYEVIGDEILSEDSSLFALYSKGQIDLFFYMLKEKMKSKKEYEKDIFILKIINYFEHEVRLNLMISSMMSSGMSSDDIINSIFLMKKLKTGKNTYSKNQIKFFISRISSDNANSIKKDNEFKLIALNSCRKILRSNYNSTLKDTHITFVIMYLVDKIAFRDFYSIVSRLKI